MATIGRLITGEGVFTAWVTGRDSGLVVHVATGLDCDLSLQTRPVCQVDGSPWADDTSGVFELTSINPRGGGNFISAQIRAGEWQYRVGCREATYTSGAAPVWLGVSGG